jgi:hypothetical protein
MGVVSPLPLIPEPVSVAELVFRSKSRFRSLDLDLDVDLDADLIGPISSRLQQV